MRSRFAAYLVILAALAGCDDAAPPDARPLTVLEAPAGCDPLSGCRVSDAGLDLQVRFATAPRVLQPFHLQLQVSGAVTVESVAVTFLMRSMDMGLNRYRLIAGPDGLWQGNVTLPVCVSGRSDWIADFEMVTAARRYRLRLPFMAEK